MKSTNTYKANDKILTKRIPDIRQEDVLDVVVKVLKRDNMYGYVKKLMKLLG